jgi:hypothetical protein
MSAASTFFMNFCECRNFATARPPISPQKILANVSKGSHSNAETLF